MDKIKHLTEIAKNLDVYDLAYPVLINDKFSWWSGSSKPTSHHYGRGGLLDHTTEVIDSCLLMSDYYKQHKINNKLLFLAALYHDYGKIYDYDYIPERQNDGFFYGCDENGRLISTTILESWTSNKHKSLIHHISRSGLFWNEIAKSKNLPEYEIDEVLHCILSHHGVDPEAGSPVPPQTRMAWILHLCDNMSASLDKIKE